VITNRRTDWDVVPGQNRDTTLSRQPFPVQPLERNVNKQSDPLAWQVHNIEAEQALIGAIFINNEAFALATKFIDYSHFYEPVHQSIYGIIEQLIGAGKHADPIIVRSFLPNDVIAPNVTTRQYLARLAAEATTIINAPEYARLIRELADRRRLSEIAHALMPADASHPASLASEAISALDMVVAASSENGAPSLDMRAAMARAVDAAAVAYQNDGHIIGVPTTLRDLDTKTGGMSRGDLVVIGGRPGMGKSAMILTILRRAAEQGFKSMLVSLEMSDVPMSHRMISDYIFDLVGDNLPYSAIRSGRFHEKLFMQIRDAALELSELPIRIEQQPGLTVSQISARARQHKRRQGLDILAIDHLDLVKASGRYAGNKVYEIGEITGALKALAKEMDIVVVLLAQLSRDVEKREDKRPQLADLRSSGSIEQDADTVIFLYRHAYYLASAEPQQGTPEHEMWQNDMAKYHNLLQAIIAKQRSGPTGNVELFCDIGNNAIRDISGEYGPGAR
jgi:replicative DNA helicase